MNNQRIKAENVQSILGSRARRSTRACAAIVWGEIDVDHTSPPSSLGFGPTDALALPGTAHRLLFPVDEEVCHVEAFVGVGLLLVLSLKARPMRSIFWWTRLKTRLLPQT